MFAADGYLAATGATNRPPGTILATFGPRRSRGTSGVFGSLRDH